MITVYVLELAGVKLISRDIDELKDNIDHNLPLYDVGDEDDDDRYILYTTQMSIEELEKLRDFDGF